MKIEATRNRQIILVEQRELNLNFYKEFSKVYLELKEAGLVSKEIRNLMTTFMKCSGTSFYSYLKEARSLGLVTDTYAENRNFGKNKRVKKTDVSIPVTVVEDGIKLDVQVTGVAYKEDGKIRLEEAKVLPLTGSPVGNLINFDDATILLPDINIECEIRGTDVNVDIEADIQANNHTLASNPDVVVNPFDITDEPNIITTTEGIMFADVDWNSSNDADKPVEESKPKENDYPINRFLNKLVKMFSLKKK